MMPGTVAQEARSCSRPKIHPLPPPLPSSKKENDTEKTQKSKISSILSRYQPSKARLLVKLSAVNGCVDELRKQVVQIEDLNKCIFVRIVQAGPEVEDRENVCPGALIVIDKNAGQKLENLSRTERHEYRMIKESHILAYADF